MFATPTAPTSSATAPRPRNRVLNALAASGCGAQRRRGLGDVDLVGVLRVGLRGQQVVHGVDLAGLGADVDRGRVRFEAEVGLGGLVADQDRGVDLGGQDVGLEDPGDVEPHAAGAGLGDPDLLAGPEPVDAQVGGCGGTEHADRLAGGGGVEELALDDRGARGGGQAQAGGIDRQAVGVDRVDQRGAVGVDAVAVEAADGGGGLDAGHAGQPGDHGGRLGGELGGAAGQARAGLDGEQVGAQRADLGQQPGGGGRRQAQDRHDRRDPDRDAQRRQAGAQFSGAQPDAGQASQVRGAQPGRGRPPGSGRGGDSDHVGTIFLTGTMAALLVRTGRKP